jgi:hypothetical protein
MAVYDNDYRNALVGILLDVGRVVTSDRRRTVIIETDEPFVRTVVRTVINDSQDAELLIDRHVCVYDGTIIPFPETR